MPPVPPGPTSRRAPPFPRFAGSGYLLPTAAAATLVLTATGAHIGGTADAPSASAAPATSLTASGLVTEDAIERDVIERSGRDSARASGLTGTDSFDAADSGRADQLDAADAADRTQAQADAAAAKAAADAAAAQAQIRPRPTPPRSRRPRPTRPPPRPTTGSRSSTAATQLTSGFGMRWGAMHPGQDFAVPGRHPRQGDVHRHRDLRRLAGRLRQQGRDPYWDGTVSWFCHNSRLS